MNKKYFASVYKGQLQSKYRPEDKSTRRLAGKVYSQELRNFFNQRGFVQKTPSLSGQSGFTLIELLVVIGIIAILAAVVIVAVNPAHQFALARDTQRSANVAAILDAVDENMTEHKGILTCNGVASILGTNPNFTMIQSGDANGGDLAPCLTPDYIPTLPYDPTTGSYTNPTNYDTGYEILKDASGHITVEAYSELLPNHGLISVTR